MATESLSARLAVIMHADVSASTMLVRQNEELAHKRIQSTFHKFQNIIEKYHGRVHELRGDALLAEFERASDAVTAALAFQSIGYAEDAIDEDSINPRLRVGLALGEVIVADGTITGAGVVLAQRLEQMAVPGGVVMQGAVHEAIPERYPFAYEYLGEHPVKGFDDPVRAFNVTLADNGEIPSPRDIEHKKSSAIFRHYILGIMAIAFIVAFVAVTLIRPGEDESKSSVVADTGATQAPRSIAISSFKNMSNDESQDYFVVGMTQDIITDLSKISGLRVITFREEPPTRQELVQKYDIQYLLEGSVRKLADRVRINVQLVDNEDGSNVWTERYDRKLADVFALQEEVARHVVGALSLTLTGEERNLLSRPETADYDAYDLFLQGQRQTRNITSESNLAARQLFERAIELDPDFARAYGALSVNHAVAYRQGWPEGPDKTLDLAIDYAEKALSLDNNSPYILWAHGYSYLFKKEYQKAIDSLEKAIHIAPSYADGYALLALINSNLGRYEQAVEQIRKAMAINPVYTFEYPYLLGRALYGARRYEQAVEALTNALERNETGLLARLFLAASYIGLDQQDDAEWEIEQILIIDPEYTTTKYESMSRIAKEGELSRFLDDLRKAGLPD
jgi:adenylate cyclase